MTGIDITVPMGAQTPEWPGDTPFSCGWSWDMAKGASVNVGRVETSLHVGTHADAPLHVTIGGAPSEALPLDAFTGPAVVVDVRGLSDDAEIAADWLRAAVGKARPERLLLRTGRTVVTGTFPAGWPALAEDAVDWLLASGLQLLGVDAPSVDLRTATDLRVHKALFGGGAWVLENLRLDEVAAGAWLLRAMPMLVTGADAAPVRATLEPLPR